MGGNLDWPNRHIKSYGAKTIKEIAHEKTLNSDYHGHDWYG